MSREEILGQVKQAFGIVPDYFAKAPDHVLAQWWAEMGWLQSDTALSARDKLLVGYGASAAIHCEYWIPFHAAQFALQGMGEEQVKEASWVASYVSGVSAYLYGIRYDKEQAKEELDQIVEHIQSAHG